VIELDLATLDFIFDTMIGTMTIMAMFSLAGLVWALKPAPTRFDWSKIGHTLRTPILCSHHRRPRKLVRSVAGCSKHDGADDHRSYRRDGREKISTVTTKKGAEAP